MSPRSFRLVQAAALALVLAGSLSSVAAKAGPPIPAVPVAAPVVREVTEFADFTGRTAPVSNVDLRARVSGYLTRAPFKEGDQVKKGDLLFELDPRPYLGDVEKAKASLTLDEVRLKSAEATFQRAKALLATRGISQEEFDKITLARDVAQARVRLGKANLNLAMMYLQFTRVTAPIDGRIGRRFLDPGSLVKADDTTLATIVSLDPMYVYFDVDERTYLRLRRLAVKGQAREKGKMRVRMQLVDENDFPHRGVVDFIDNRVDPNTGTIRLRATFTNAGGLLLPGLFTRVRLATSAPFKALLIPTRAVVEFMGGTGEIGRFVFVVNDKNQIDLRDVELGAKQEKGLVVVKKGLKAEDRVVIDGQLKLSLGMTVKPRKVDLP